MAVLPKDIIKFSGNLNIDVWLYISSSWHLSQITSCIFDSEKNEVNISSKYKVSYFLP